MGKTDPSDHYFIVVIPAATGSYDDGHEALEALITAHYPGGEVYKVNDNNVVTMDDAANRRR